MSSKPTATVAKAVEREAVMARTGTSATMRMKRVRLVEVGQLASLFQYWISTDLVGFDLSMARLIEVEVAQLACMEIGAALRADWRPKIGLLVGSSGHLLMRIVDAIVAMREVPAPTPHAMA